jgi:hypothetical protein
MFIPKIQDKEAISIFNNRTIRVTRGVHGFVLEDVTHAGKKGKLCARVSVQHENFGGFYQVDGLLEEALSLLSLAADLADDGAWQEHENRRDSFDEYEIYTSVKKSIRVWPADLEVIKPLKEMPKRWNLETAIRALVNGQFKSNTVKCTGYYTDDYHGDAARNYEKGAIDALNLAREVFTSPSGWWSSVNKENRVFLCCHSFNNNEFVLDLNAA